MGILFLMDPFGTSERARAYRWAFEVLPEKVWAWSWIIMGAGLLIGKLARSRWAIRLSIMYSMWTQFVFALSIILFVFQENGSLGGLAGAVMWFSPCLIGSWILNDWYGDHY